MDLSPSFKLFLADLIENGGERELREGAESLPGLKLLEREGYIRLVPALCGPLGVRTGAYFAQITEAGRAAYAATLPPDLAQWAATSEGPRAKLTDEPRPGDCYARRWYGVERADEQSHVRVRMLGMGEDKPLVGVTLCGTFQDRIMTRLAFDDEFLPCPADAHNHAR